MFDILAITGPIYITIVLGFITTRLGLFSKADMHVLGRFVINLALPALLFNALAQRPIGDILNSRYLLIYAVGSLVTVALAVLWARRAVKKNIKIDTGAYWISKVSYLFNSYFRSCRVVFWRCFESAPGWPAVSGWLAAANS